MSNLVPPPPGMRVPNGGSSCTSCMYLAADRSTCDSPIYQALTYRGKARGDRRFVDGKTGQTVRDSNEFCCNAYDWEEDEA